MTPLTSANFDSAYGSMIAGAVPMHTGDVDKTVFMMAQDVLGTPRLHLLVSVDAASATVYYLAAPSSGFTSIPLFATPLAACMPGHPQHQGDGIYFLQDINLSVAVEKERDHIRLVANSTEAMREWLADRSDLPVYPVDASEAWTMESVPGAYRRLADGISLRTAKYSSVIGAIALLMYGAAAVGVSVQNAAADQSNQANMRAINEAVTRIDFVSPLAQQVARVQRVSALVVRAGGWIDEYDLKDGTEKFVLMMPAWITKDYIDALGARVEADQATDENLIRVSLGMPLPGTTPVMRPLVALPPPVPLPQAGAAAAGTTAAATPYAAARTRPPLPPAMPGATTDKAAADNPPAANRTQAPRP